MIPARQLVVDFDREYNRLNSSYNNYIRIEEKIAYINKAKDLFFEDRARRVETDSEVRFQLRPLEVKEQSLTITSSNDKYIVSALPTRHYKTIRQRIRISKEDCPTIEIPVIPFRTADVDRALKDPFWKPSYLWEHTFGDEAENSLYVWHESDFVIEDVIIDYIKKPNNVQAPSMTSTGSYVYSDGVVYNTDIDLELDPMCGPKIINMAVLMANSSAGDAKDFQIKSQEIQTTRDI